MSGSEALLGFSAALLFVFAGYDGASAADCPASVPATTVVAEVIDGETLRLADGTVARLIGIEAPKLPLAAGPDGPWPPADAATAEARRLVGSAPIGIVSSSDGLDRYGRRRVHAFLPDGGSLAGQLIAGGFVRVHWLPGEAACLGALLAAEKAARRAHRGIWANPEYAVRRAEDASLLGRNGLYELVEGRVVSVGHGSSMIFLDFGRNYRSDFTILVSPPVADALGAMGMPVDGLAERRVLVRGVIEDRSGPAIRLYDPAQLELVDE